MGEGEARAGGEGGGGGEEAEVGAGADVDIDVGDAIVEEEGGWLGPVAQYDIAQYGPTFARTKVAVPLEARLPLCFYRTLFSHTLSLCTALE